MGILLGGSWFKIYVRFKYQSITAYHFARDLFNVKFLPNYVLCRNNRIWSSFVENTFKCWIFLQSLFHMIINRSHFFLASNVIWKRKLMIMELFQITDFNGTLSVPKTVSYARNLTLGTREKFHSSKEKWVKATKRKNRRVRRHLGD